MFEWKGMSRVVYHYVVSGVFEMYDLLFRRVSDSLCPYELLPRRLCYLVRIIQVLLSPGLMLYRL